MRIYLRVRSVQCSFNIDLVQMLILSRIRTLRPNQMANATLGHRFLWHVPGKWTKGVLGLSLSTLYIYLATATPHSGSICAGLPEQTDTYPETPTQRPGNGVARLLTILIPCFIEAQVGLQILTLTSHQSVLRGQRHYLSTTPRRASKDSHGHAAQSPTHLRWLTRTTADMQRTIVVTNDWRRCQKPLCSTLTDDEGRQGRIKQRMASDEVKMFMDHGRTISIKAHNIDSI